MSAEDEGTAFPGSAAEQQAEANNQRSDSLQTDDLRELATEIQHVNEPDYTPATVKKGIVTAVADSASPPTISVNLSGDDTVEISGVRHLDSYSPVVGDTCLIIKQGADFFALGQINNSNEGNSAQGWQTPGFGSGFSGTMQYRKVLEHGDRKVQFKGTVNRSANTTIMTLPVGFRPSAARTLLAARNGDAASIKVTINTNGTVVLTDGTAIPNTDSTTPSNTGNASGSTENASGETGSAGSHTHSISQTSFIAEPPHTHSHGGSTGSAGSHTHSVGNHSHSMPNHSHASAAHSHTNTLALPTVISFDGLEMFL